MSRSRLLRRLPFVAGALAVALILGAGRPGRPPAVLVYKSPSCGCCSKWVDHMRQQGFTVTTQDLDDVSPMKRELAVPHPLESCHTALVDGYVIEGHVPAADITRLLRDRPKVAGLAVPGMVTGSPGMEGGTPEAYDVLTFDARGGTTVFAKH